MLMDKFANKRFFNSEKLIFHGAETEGPKGFQTASTYSAP
jgi:hypothetical protein